MGEIEPGVEDGEPDHRALGRQRSEHLVHPDLLQVLLLTLQGVLGRGGEGMNLFPVEVGALHAWLVA
jgi:hypothetical protein